MCCAKQLGHASGPQNIAVTVPGPWIFSTQALRTVTRNSVASFFFLLPNGNKKNKQPITSLRSAIMPMEAHWPICPRSQEKVGRVACGQRLLATSDTQENKLFNTFTELVNPCIRDSCNLCEFVQSTELAVRFISYITLHRAKKVTALVKGALVVEFKHLPSSAQINAIRRKRSAAKQNRNARVQAGI